MKSYIKGFDGIRGIAAVSVVFCHCVAGATQIGGFAVNIFFALSGFLILRNIFDARSKVDAKKSSSGHELILFLSRRMRRILPAYYIVSAIVLPILLIIGSLNLIDVAMFLLYLQNYLIAYLGEWLSYSYTWTLAVEQQFYVLFAPALLFISARHHKLTLGIAAFMMFLIVTILFSTGVKPFFIFRLPFFGFMLASLGGLHALVSKDSTLSRMVRGDVTAVVTCVTIILAVLPSSIFAGRPFALFFQTMLSGFFLPFIVAFVAHNPESTVVRYLESRPLRFLGLISYSLYLIHGVLAEMLKAHWPILVSGPAWLAFALSRLSLFAAVLGISIILAYASYTYVERAFIKPLHRRNRDIDAGDIVLTEV